MNIAIQGGDASFHDYVARYYFKELSGTVKCDTFKELAASLKSGVADFAVIAIENTIAGSILPNYQIIKENNFKIIGEVKLRIVMNLMALPGQKINDLTSARSHYMALLQCSDFLEAHPHLMPVEVHDTADSAKEIAQKKMYGAAAIAGKQAAELYNLELLAEGIETNKQNYTRFLIIARNEYQYTGQREKASINFVVKNEVGSLNRVLMVFEKNRINLTKIQSLPLLGDPFNYTFYAGCEWEHYADFTNTIQEIKPFIQQLHILGEYPKGETIIS